MTPEEMQDRLRESGIDSELVTYQNPKAVGVKWQANGIVWTYDWYGQTPQALSTCMHYLPEQAIAATVGAGTCKDLGGTGANGEDVFNCSECGCVLSLYDGEGVNTLCTSFIYDYPRFCPECGARVVSE